MGVMADKSTPTPLATTLAMARNMQKMHEPSTSARTCEHVKSAAGKRAEEQKRLLGPER